MALFKREGREKKSVPFEERKGGGEGHHFEGERGQARRESPQRKRKGEGLI